MMEQRILIVDDEAAFLLAMKRILQSNTVQIDTAQTIEQAMALLEMTSYHVVIADVRLTLVLREEGLEVLQHVKLHAPSTKVIILTGYGSASVMERACTLGADMFFEKPLQTQLLKNTLRCWGVAC